MNSDETSGALPERMKQNTIAAAATRETHMRSSKEDDGIESSVEGDVKDSVWARLGESMEGRVCNHGDVDSSGIDVGVGHGRGTAENDAEKSEGDRVGEGDEQAFVGGGLDGSVGDKLGNSVEEDSAGGMVGNSVGGGEGGMAEAGVGSAAGEGCAEGVVKCSCTEMTGDSEEDGEDWMGGGLGGSAGNGVETSVGVGVEECVGGGQGGCAGNGVENSVGGDIGECVGGGQGGSAGVGVIKPV